MRIAEVAGTMTGNRRMAGNTAATVAVRGLVGGLKSVALIFVARWYGPEQFGRLAVVLACFEIFRTLGEFGLGTIGIRRFARREAIVKPLVRLNVAFSFAGYLISLVFVNLAYPNPGYGILMGVVGLSLFTQSLTTTCQAYYQARLHMSKIVRASLCGGAVYLLLTAALLYVHAPLVMVVLLIPLSEALVLSLVYGGWKHELAGEARGAPKTPDALSLVREAWPVVLTAFVAMTYLRGDNLLLSWFQSESEVGTYAACSRLLEPFLVLAGAVSTTFYAALSLEHQAKDSRLIFMKFLVPFFLLASAVSASVFFLSSAIADAILPSYQRAGRVLAILSLSILLKSINMNLTAIIYSKGHFRRVTVVALVNLAVNFTANLVLIPLYGSVGSAISIVGSEGINCVVQGFLCRKIFREEVRA